MNLYVGPYTTRETLEHWKTVLGDFLDGDDKSLEALNETLKKLSGIPISENSTEIEELMDGAVKAMRESYARVLKRLEEDI